MCQSFAMADSLPPHGLPSLKPLSMNSQTKILECICIPSPKSSSQQRFKPQSLALQTDSLSSGQQEVERPNLIPGDGEAAAFIKLEAYLPLFISGTNFMPSVTL